jgi:LCP family protein required for cell wall assembly
MARSPRPRRTWPQRLFLLTNLVVIVVALMAAYGLSLARSTTSQIQRVVIGSTLDPQPEAGEPVNYLLVGVDDISGLPDDHPLREGRDSLQNTDTIMVLRLFPSTGEAAIMSFPRDLWVTLSGTGTQERINAAFVLGGSDGRATLVNTIKESFGIPVHNYLQVDFNGFLEVIDELGGVTLYIEHPLRDPKAQLDIQETGCVNLSPEQALAYVRTRTLEEFVDGEWRLADSGDSPDLDRNRRQQDFLIATLRKAIARGARNPIQARDLIRATVDHVTVDDTLTIGAMLDLATDFRDFNPESLQRYVLPVTNDRIDGKAVLRLDTSEAQDELDVFRGVESERPAGVRVQVLNGTGEPGLGQVATDALAALGFTIDAPPADAEQFDIERTVLRYPPGGRASARLLARAFAGDVEFEERPADGSDTVLAVLGADRLAVRTTLAPGGGQPGGTGTTPTEDPTGPTATPPPTDPSGRCL